MLLLTLHIVRFIQVSKSIEPGIRRDFGNLLKDVLGRYIVVLMLLARYVLMDHNMMYKKSLLTVIQQRAE